ncbi:8839_t:CDS:2 [Entrophospora sp. SA101]|nr:8839_t:CDS:2 [Entrophospora sp. SA101]
MTDNALEKLKLAFSALRDQKELDLHLIKISQNLEETRSKEGSKNSENQLFTEMNYHSHGTVKVSIGGIRKLVTSKNNSNQFAVNLQKLKS